MTDEDNKAIEHLKQAVAEGRHWYVALLEAIRLWKSTEEDYEGRHYCYLISGEAFDWLVLAERLCQEISDSIPEKERIALLFLDRSPLELTKEEFKDFIGEAKYQAYLNYVYGVLVEDALILSVTAEVRKERQNLGIERDENTLDKAYHRIYEAGQLTLLKCFRKERGYPQRNSMSLTELKEFKYWLFKYRLKICDKSRVASDTRKALIYLHCNLTSKLTS